MKFLYFLYLLFIWTLFFAYWYNPIFGAFGATCRVTFFTLLRGKFKPCGIAGEVEPTHPYEYTALNRARIIKILCRGRDLNSHGLAPAST